MKDKFLGYILTGYNDKIGEFKLVPLQNTKEDYRICKDIFTDENIMSKSTIFNRNIGTEEQIKHVFELYTKSWETDNIGEYKIIDSNNNLIGISGFIISERDKNNKASVLNLGVYLKKDASINFISEIFRLVTNYVYTIKTIEEIIAYTSSENLMTCISLLKAQYKLIGKLSCYKGDIVFFNIYQKDYLLSDKKIKVFNSVKSVIKEVRSFNSIVEKIYINYLKL
jgi:hypothetical protein